ncbi:MAG: hypothetical protein GXO89_04220 [Chlorobi bacterium]|nr:hypothetical protein [Chlorobiota bacterium]
MEEPNEKLSPQEKIEQENFVLKSKLITQGGIFSESQGEIDPEIENMFLKRVMAFEEAEWKPVYEIIGVDPKSFPPADLLSEEELEVEFNKLLDIFEEHGMKYAVNEDVPVGVSYRFLTEDYILSESQDLPKDFGWTIDGCSGDCPSCFQMDFCKSKDDIWPPEELKAEIKRREEEGF